jgi:hypothetical protein
VRVLRVMHKLPWSGRRNAKDAEGPWRRHMTQSMRTRAREAPKAGQRTSFAEKQARMCARRQVRWLPSGASAAAIWGLARVLPRAMRRWARSDFPSAPATPQSARCATLQLVFAPRPRTAKYLLLSQRINAALKGSVATEQVGPLALKGLTQAVVAYNVPLAANQPALRVIEGGPSSI